jgi:hypothetical protein
MKMRLSCILTVAVAIFAQVSISAGQSAVPTTSLAMGDTPVGPLPIHVTAVQPSAEYRNNSDAKWERLNADVDLPVGVELQTGPKGVIQFAVGTDQVYRVDWLTSAKVLRANLLPDGTIKTDVAMKYGHISKDVDAPVHPHKDTIVSPCCTLEIRGTRVSLYDQPPFEPEAVSLTGAAVLTSAHGVLKFGAKGKGTVNARDAAVSTGVAKDKLYRNAVGPAGVFAGQTTSEQQELAAISSLVGTNSIDFSSLSRILASEVCPPVSAAPLDTDQELYFQLDWSGPASTMVSFTIEGPGPNGQTVSINNRIVSSGGMYNTNSGQSPTAKANGNGTQEIDWGNLSATAPFPLGTYTITETLEGTSTQTLAQDPNIMVDTQLYARREHNKKNGMLDNVPARNSPVDAVLNAQNPTATFSSTVPKNVAITLTQTSGLSQAAASARR